MNDSLWRITLRAAGRLLAAGIITRDLAALMVRDLWDLIEARTAGRPSEKARAMDTNPHIASPSGLFDAALWCGSCVGIPHRVLSVGGLCPSCADTKARAS